MANSLNANCDEALKQCLKETNSVLKSTEETMSDIISSFGKLQLVQTVDELITDDEDDVDCNITDDEEYFSFCDGSNEIESSVPLDFTLLYKSTYENLPLELLREKCNQLCFKITDLEANEIEKLTHNQSYSTQWHQLRKGRITASAFKAVCSTSVDKPSLSLLNKICYPQEVAFTSVYTEWGRSHEKQALNEFVNKIKRKHTNFINSDSGLVVLPEYPYFGASPDGLCSCDCCGKGCIEIKCPYKLKDGESIDALTTKANHYLIKNNGQYYLNKHHAYYFQVQMQLFLTKSCYCYFVVWGPKTMAQIKILPDERFWSRHSAKAENFFNSVVLPELLGKYFTRQQDKIIVQESSNDKKVGNK